MRNLILLMTLAWFSCGSMVFGNESELPEKFRKHVSILASDSLQGRGLGTKGAELAREYIVSMFEEAKIQPFPELGGQFLQPFRFRQNIAWIDAWNIVGYIEGSDPVLKDEFILIGAHWDHLGYELQNEDQTIYPGADDNASGVAAIIELARYFAENPQLLGRSLILVAFDAEESGLIGSKHFVENSPVPLSDIKLMFSFDMVGMYETNNGLHLSGMGSLENGKEMAAALAAKHDLKLHKMSGDIERRTDTAPFGDSGVPAVHVFTGSKSPYHKPEDQYDLLDYEGMEKIYHYMTDVLSSLSVEAEIPPSSSLIDATGKNNGNTSRVSAGLLINTGVGFHRYDDEFFRANSSFAGTAGFYLQIPLNKIFTLQQELLYDVNGSKMESGDFRRHSVTLPLNLQLGTPRTLSIPIRFYSFAGAWFRYNFAGNQNGNSLDFAIYNDQEWGYSLGLAVEIFMVTIGYTHRRAITGIYKDTGLKIYDSNGYFTLGYRF